MSKPFELTISANDFKLPETYNEFCKNIKKKLEEHAYGMSEELLITYRNNDQTVNVTNIDEYKEMVRNLKGQKEMKFNIQKTNIVDEGDNFKSYVTAVVEQEMKACRDAIIQRLNSKELELDQLKANNSCKKVRTEKCIDCNKPILYGFLYRETLDEIDGGDRFYCENCAQNKDKPLFKIY